MDRAWWEFHIDEVRSVFGGRLFTSILNFCCVERVNTEMFRNSGAGAIVTAIRNGSRRIILLGYDCQKTGGKAHWHEDHPTGLGNAESIGKWPRTFDRVAEQFPAVEIINSSRETALTRFPREDIEGALS
jgi:hypothetical protein